MRDVERLRKEAEALPREEQLQLAEILLANTKLTSNNADLDSFWGCLTLTIDPLEFQRSIRSEWP